MPREPQNSARPQGLTQGVPREKGTYRPLRGARSHVIILDGTMSSLKTGAETHAGQTYKLLVEAGGPQTVYYEAGLQWQDWRSTWEVATGKGFSKQIIRAYGYLASNYQPGDDVYFFGYSRGAYAVRSLAGMIDRLGLVAARHATERNVQLAFRYYRHAPESAAARAFRDRYCHQRVCLEMVGVWDTVKALGLRLPIIWRYSAPTHDYHNHQLGRSIRHGFHALAYHERRSAYEPVLWHVPRGHGSQIEQVWFPGNHGDVGGQLCGRNHARPLANLSLVWMLGHAETCGLMLPGDWRRRFPTDPDAPSMGGWVGWSKLFLARKRRKMLVDATERLHPSLEKPRSPRPIRAWMGALMPHKKS